MSVEFLSRQELVMGVLGLKIVPIPQISGMSESLKAGIVAAQGIRLSNQDLRGVRKDFESGGKVRGILRESCRGFTFPADICEEIVALENEPTTVWECLAHTLLKCTMIWFVDKSVDVFMTLAHAYRVCIHQCWECCDPSGEFMKLMYGGFYYSFKSYISKCPFPKFLESKSVFMEVIVEFQNVDPRYFDIFLQILHKMPAPEGLLSDEVTEVLSLVAIIQNAHNVRFRKEFVEDIVLFILNSIIKLDPYALTFFGYFSWAIEQNKTEVYMAQIADSLADMILSGEKVVKIEVPDGDDLSCGDEQISLNDECCHFLDTQICLQDMDFDKGIVFPDSVLLETLLPNGVSSIAIALSNIFTRGPLHAVSFSERFAARVKQSFEGIAVLLYVLKDVATCDQCVEWLFDSVLYDGRLTMFSESPATSELSTLRAVAFDLLKPTTSDSISRLIDKVKRKPLILAEHCYRLVQSQVCYSMRADVRTRIAYGILKAANYYKVTRDDIPGIERGLTSIFVLLSHMLSIDEFNREFFKEVFFASSFVSFVFEDALKGFVIRVVQDHLNNSNPPDEELPPLLANVLVVSMDSFGSDRIFQLIIDILRALNGLLSVKCKLPASIVVIRAALPDVLISMTEFPENPLTKQIFLEALQFFTLTSGTEKSKTMAVSSFTKAMSKLYGTNIPEDFYLKIIQLLAGTSLSSVKPNFVIREPRFVTFFIDTYSRSNKFGHVLDFMCELCKFSQHNCVACHTGKADLYLLNLMKKGHQSVEIVGQCMKILVLIASLRSSAEVVQNFVSLLSSKNGIISPLEPVYLKTMTAIVSQSALRPYTYFPLISDGIHISIPKIQGKMLSNGFTFGCWLFADNFSASYVPHLFTLKDESGQYCKLTMKYGAFIVEMKTKKTRSESIIEMKGPINSWSLVTLTCCFDEELIRTCFHLNGKTIQEMSFPKCSFLTPMTLSAGRTDVNSVDSDDTVKMASFGLFPALQIDDVMFLQQSGPRMLYRPAFDVVFAARTTKRGNHVGISVIKGISDIIVEGESTVIETNFADILVETCSVELLLPLFSQMDCHDPDGNPFSNCIGLSLELFAITVTSSIEAQKSLVESDACSVIADILKNVKKTHLSYSLYLKLFGFFQAIQHPPLQQELVRRVLFNCEVLKRCDDDSQLLIVKHWTRTLFPVSVSLGFQLPSLSDILAILDIYFWYKKVSDDQYGTSPARDVAQIRNLMFEIASLVDVTKADVVNIISFCVTCADDHQVHDVLEFLQSLAKEDRLKGLNSAFTKLQAHRLLSLCRSEIPQLILDAIKTMFVLIDQELLGSTAKVEVVEIAMNLISYEDCTGTLFRLLKDLFDDNPELLPLVAWIAYILHIDSFFVSLAPSPKYCTHFSWPIWPISIALKSSDAIREILVQFLVKCNSDEWENLICTAGVVATAFQKDPCEIQKLLLCKICQIYINGFHSGSPNVIYDLTYRLMFFKAANTPNDALDSELRSSLYPVGSGLIHGRSTARFIPKVIRKCPVRTIRSKSTLPKDDSHTAPPPTSPTKRKDLLPLQLYDVISHVDETRPALSFGLSLSASGAWKDTDLAVFFLRIFCEKPNPAYYPMATVTLAFLNRIGSAVAHDIYLSPSKDPVGSDALLAYETMKYEQKPSTAYASVAKAPLMLGDIMRAVFSQKLTRTEISALPRLKLFLSSIWQKTSIITSAGQNERDFCHEFSENVKKRNNTDHIMWQKLWQKLTSVKAPWNESEENLPRIQRSSRICSSFCPMKFKSELTGNKESYDFQFQSPKQRLKKKRRSLTGMKPLDLNATVVSPKKRTGAMLTVEPYGYKLDYNRDQEQIEYDSVLHSVFLRKSLERPSRVYLVMKNRKPLLAECGEDMLRQAPAWHQRNWNEKWTGKWVNRKMSTFSYLMKLNVFYGRNFSDLDSYPVMPSLVRGIVEPNLPTRLVTLNYLKSIEPFSKVALEHIMTQSELDEYDWIPEMYFDSKILPFSEVYQNRKALESDDFSCHLTEWIEAVWPVNMPHPVRREYVSKPLTIKKYEVPLQQITAATVVRSKSGSTLVVFGDGKISTFDTSGMVSSRQFKLPGDRVLVTSFRKAIVVAKYKSLDITLVNQNTGAANELKTKTGAIVAMCSDADKLILAMRDTIIKIIDRNLNTTILRTYFCAVTCVDYRHQFDLIVLGNKEGSLLLCSMSKQRVASSLKLKNKRAIAITITPKWGFIVVLAADKYRSTNWLCTYTINGDFIEEAKDTREITAICSFSSGTGFDYIATGDVNGLLSVCEAATPSRLQTLARTQSRIVTLNYDPSTASLIALTASGRVVVVAPVPT